MTRLLAKGTKRTVAPRPSAAERPSGTTRRVDLDHSSATAGRRLPELDALRGLACLVILIYHIKPHAVPGGWAAVDLFFLLSGYLITSILLRDSGERRFLVHFYARRALRIWPVYYLTVLVVALAVPWLPRPHDFGALASILTFTQNVSRYWSGSTREFSPYLSHVWSLAVEEQFYLIWPALVCLFGRRGVVPLALLLLGGSVLARGYGFHWWLLLARGDGLALGALLAVLMSDLGGALRAPSGWKWIFVATSAAALAYLVALGANGGMSTVGPPRWPALTLLAVNLLGFGVVGLVLCHEGRPALRVLRGRRLVGLGTVSYGLYMYHYVILLLSDDLARRLGLNGRPFWRDALNVALILTLAALSWRYVERPFLRLKDRFAYRPLARESIQGHPNSAVREVNG